MDIGKGIAPRVEIVEVAANRKEHDLCARRDHCKGRVPLDEMRQEGAVGVVNAATDWNRARKSDPMRDLPPSHTRAGRKGS